MNTVKWPVTILLFLLMILAAPLTGKQDKKRAVKPAVAAKKKPLAKKKKAPAKKDPAAERKKRDKKNAKKIKEVIAFGLHDERKEAINQILKLKDPGLKKEMAELLLKILPDELNSEVKVKAMTVLGELKPKKGDTVFKGLLSDKSEDVRVAAVGAIKNNELKGLSKELIAELKKQDLEKDSRYLEALLTALGEFKAPGLTEYTQKAISNAETARPVRERLVLLLGKLQDKKSTKFLLKLYEDETEERIVRSYAINALGKMKVKEAIGPIKKVLEEIDTYSFKKKRSYFTLSMYSVAALVKLGDKSAVPRLMDSLKSTNPTMRLKAIRLLSDLNDKRTIDILKYKMKYDPNTRVQKRAREALKKMGVDVEEDEKKPEKKKKGKK